MSTMGSTSECEFDEIGYGRRYLLRRGFCPNPLLTLLPYVGALSFLLFLVLGNHVEVFFISMIGCHFLTWCGIVATSWLGSCTITFGDSTIVINDGVRVWRCELFGFDWNSKPNSTITIYVMDEWRQEVSDVVVIKTTDVLLHQVSSELCRIKPAVPFGHENLSFNIKARAKGMAVAAVGVLSFCAAGVLDGLTRGCITAITWNVYPAPQLAPRGAPAACRLLMYFGISCATIGMSAIHAANQVTIIVSGGVCALACVVRANQYYHGGSFCHVQATTSPTRVG